MKCKSRPAQNRATRDAHQNHRHQMLRRMPLNPRTIGINEEMSHALSSLGKAQAGQHTVCAPTPETLRSLGVDRNLEIPLINDVKDNGHDTKAANDADFTHKQQRHKPQSPEAQNLMTPNKNKSKHYQARTAQTTMNMATKRWPYTGVREYQGCQ